MEPKVLAIVGPTASGKTSLSITLAQQFNGEVISADSRQVYRGLNLCSGKVTAEEMQGVTHHLLDVTDPLTVYTASDYVRDATTAISNIHTRGRLPIIAGGTFFYLDALLGRVMTPAVPPNPELRAELEARHTDELFEQLRGLDPVRADTVDRANPRRLIRAIEVATALGRVPLPVTEERYDCLTLGIHIARETLHQNIHARLIERLKLGMLDEISTLLAAGVTHERLEALGLEARYCSRHLRGLLNYDEMVTTIETKTRQFAKRQMTWLKRDPRIIWINKSDLALLHNLVTDFLNR